MTRKKEKELSFSQLTWLTQRGDRHMGDVLQDKGGLYVLMRAYGEDERVYLPD